MTVYIQNYRYICLNWPLYGENDRKITIKLAVSTKITVTKMTAIHHWNYRYFKKHQNGHYFYPKKTNDHFLLKTTKITGIQIDNYRSSWLKITKITVIQNFDLDKSNGIRLGWGTSLRRVPF